MRISDWSSDVCSSDLHKRARLWRAGAADCRVASGPDRRTLGGPPYRPQRRRPRSSRRVGATSGGDRAHRLLSSIHARRSEEHTSELQSLMRISYAVFCLKKKTHQNTSKISTTLIRNTTQRNNKHNED